MVNWCNNIIIDIFVTKRKLGLANPFKTPIFKTFKTVFVLNVFIVYGFIVLNRDLLSKFNIKLY